MEPCKKKKLPAEDLVGGKSGRTNKGRARSHLEGNRDELRQGGGPYSLAVERGTKSQVAKRRDSS